MKLEHRPVNFEDARGAITDIFTNGAKDHVTVITSKKGAVRGNHYHKQSIQYTFIVSGQISMLSQKLGEKNIEKTIMRAGDLMTHDANEIHELIADEDSVFLAFADGLRGGEAYEKDTYRIETPLHEQLSV